MKLSLRIAAIFAGLLVALTGAFFAVASSDWLAGQIRAEAIHRLEASIGGKVEIGRLTFDWRALTLTIDNLVIRGRESVPAEPLAAVERTTVQLRIVSFVRRDVDLAGIDATRPRIHLMVQPDGSTNLPLRPPARRSVGADLIALQIRRLLVSDGLLIADIAGAPRRTIPWSVRAEKLGLRVAWNPAHQNYSAAFSVMPLRLALQGLADTDISIEAEAGISANEAVISRARLSSGESRLTLTNLRIADFANPRIEAAAAGSFALEDLARISKNRTPVKGDLGVNGSLEWNAAGYRLSGDATARSVSVAGFSGLTAGAKFVATPDLVRLENATLRLRGGAVTGVAELRRLNDFTFTGRASNITARELADAISAEMPPWDGVVAGDVSLSGTLSGTLHEARTHLSVSPALRGPGIHGDVTAVWNGATRQLDLGRSRLDLPSSYVELSGIVGQRLDVRAETSSPEDFRPVLGDFELPLTLRNGLAQFIGSVTGPADDLHVSGRAALQNAEFHGELIESAQGQLAASRNELNLTGVTARVRGLEARGAAKASLTGWMLLPESHIEGSAEMANADVAGVVALTGRSLDLKGSLRASAKFSGTVAAPRGEGDVIVTRGALASQPFDSITSHVTLIDPATQTLSSVFVSGPKRVTLSARRSGTRASFEFASNSMPLEQIALLRARRPDLSGSAEIRGSGVVDFANGWRLEALDSSGTVSSIALGNLNFGAARFSLRGANNQLDARFDSDSSGAAIHGESSVTLSGDFPARASITLSEGSLSSLGRMLGRNNIQFEGRTRGSVSLSGSLRHPDQFAGSLEIPELEVRPVAAPLADFVFRSRTPIRGAITQSTLRLSPTVIAGPETDLTIDGELGLRDLSRITADLRVRGGINLALARNLSPDLTAAGSVALDTSIRGTLTEPVFAGRAQIRGGDFRYAGFANGLSKVTGEIAFSGSRATIQSLTGESGGGRVEATGFAALNGDLVAFRLDTRASGVRVRYPEGVSSVSDAAITIAGTPQRSEASGTVTIHRLAVSPRADLAGMLASAAEPPAGLATTGLMAGMNLDVQVATAPDVAFETDLAQSIQADANLRIRGTAANPALLGRVNVTHGELVFFGNKYTIGQGAVNFFNPSRIEPVVNLDLTTRARGVEVVLTVAGPPDRLNMSYRSDPPLEFSDIINLLATGRAPGNQTAATAGTGPKAGFEQLGAAALLGQALANPVAGRLQRFFGVSRLKIDPQLTGLSGSPQARLTIEQQVTPDILFTYITDVARTNNQLIRVEWALNRQVSAILVREENGYVGIDFAFKKRFK